MLGINDLKEIITRLTGQENQLSDIEIDRVIRHVLDEGDLDDDGAISFAEFEHIIDRSSDFAR